MLMQFLDEADIGITKQKQPVQIKNPRKNIKIQWIFKMRRCFEKPNGQSVRKQTNKVMAKIKTDKTTVNKTKNRNHKIDHKELY